MEAFFRNLRALRVQAGLSIDELAERSHFPADVLTAAETGPEIPPNPVVVAFARACGAPVSEWEDRWRAATRATKNAPAVDGRETVAQSSPDTETGAAAAAPIARLPRCWASGMLMSADLPPRRARSRQVFVFSIAP